MSQLIVLRQRIRAIETIRKITHAMQLISMSSHSRLRQKKTFIEHYRKAISSVWCKLIACTPDWQASLTPLLPQKLIIVIGAQKGLAGNFNTQLIRFFQQEVPSLDGATRLITVGKHLTHQLTQAHLSIGASYTNFTLNHLSSLADLLARDIINHRYNSVIVYSSYSKTFFLQKQKKTTVIPYEHEIAANACTPIDCVEYSWEQGKHDIIKTLMHLNLNALLLDLLFDSLLAEQAARFISMESATRNAQNLLNEMRLEYNKRRQARITLELTDLATSSFGQR